MDIRSKKKAVRNLSYIAFGFLAASFFSFSGVKIAQADGVEVSGYIDTLFDAMKEGRGSAGN
jgi:hypothetical protein